MPLDREDTALQIESLIQSKRRLDACMDTAEQLFGSEIIEGKIFTVSYQLIDQQVKLIEAASELPVDVSWFVYENDCGRKEFEAGPEGDIRAVRTVEDLMDLAEAEKKDGGPMSKPLTEKQSKILMAMYGNGWMSPTEIGKACDVDVGKASSWACSGLKILVRNGYIKRQVQGPFSVDYALTMKAIGVVEGMMEVQESHKPA